MYISSMGLLFLNVSMVFTGCSVASLIPFKNPIISGFAPDPSCIRVENRYFCVTSSFNAFPGIPVYTSRDLVQWEQIGNVLSRESQLPTLADNIAPTGGIWAATIRYHDNRFYVTSTLVFDVLPANNTSRWDNLIFTNDDIWSENGNGWSDPVHFKFPGYDTSLFWDDDGKIYVQGSHNWQVYPAIQQFEINLETGESLSGDPMTLWNGTGGLAPEGPHIYKKDGYYYLLIAEGGTGLNHMVTMARATNIWGPYTPCSYNPVLTNANTTEYLQTVGHADVFQDEEGNWWSVALATRNGTVNYPMGRETVLVPVVWNEGEFPVFNGGMPGRATIEMEGPLPSARSVSVPTDSVTDSVLVGHDQTIDFSSKTLPRQLIYFRYPNFSSFTISPHRHNESLSILGSSQNITGPTGLNGTSTFIARRQDQVVFSATVGLDFLPQNNGEEAGMTLFLQRTQHFDLGVVALNSSGLFVRLRTITAISTEEGERDPISRPGIVKLPDDVTSLRLRIRALNATTYDFSYSIGSIWTILGYGAASEVSGGFTGTLVGMFATGNGVNSTTPALFRNFEYDVDPCIR